MSAHDAYLGVGHLTLIPGGANPTPIQVARLRDISLKISKETKPLESDRLVAHDSALVGVSVTLSVKSVEWRADAVAAIFSGLATSSVGRLIGIDGETGTIPGSPYALTVANTTGFVDLGVEDVTASIAAGVRKFLKRVASAPATGEYSVTTGGVYTFAAADTGHVVRFRYYYSNATAGKTVKLSNVAQRLDTSFIATVFNTNAAGKDYGYRFPAAYVETFGLAFKAKDWSEQDVEIKCYGDSLDEVLSLYQS